MGISNKLVELLSAGQYNTVNFVKRFGPTKSALNYGNYAWYLATTWAPRVSYIETTTAAYTLKKNQYSVYIVYGLIGGFIASQIALDCAYESQAQKYYLKQRQ